MTDTAQTLAQKPSYEKDTGGIFDRNHADPKQPKGTFLHEKCALCVHLKTGQKPTETPSSTVPCNIAEVLSAWPNLPEAIKAGVLALVRAARF